jgi:hypothetical protein
MRQGRPIQRDRQDRHLAGQLKYVPAYALTGLTFVTVSAVSGMWMLGLVAMLALGATFLLYISLTEL